MEPKTHKKELKWSLNDRFSMIFSKNGGSSVRSLGVVLSTASPRVQSTLRHLLRLEILCRALDQPVLDEPVPAQPVFDQTVLDEPLPDFSTKSRVVSEVIRGCAVNGIAPRAEYRGQ